MRGQGAEDGGDGNDDAADDGRRDVDAVICEQPFALIIGDSSGLRHESQPLISECI